MLSAQAQEILLGCLHRGLSMVYVGTIMFPCIAADVM